MQTPATVLQNGWKMCCGPNVEVAVAQLKQHCTTATGNRLENMLERRSGNTMSGPWFSSRVEFVNGKNEAEHRESGMTMRVADFGPTALHTLQATASNGVVMVPLSAANNYYYLLFVTLYRAYMSNGALVRPRRSPPIIMQSQVRWKIYSFF